MPAIDFTQFEEKGLFLISGGTGAGKTGHTQNWSVSGDLLILSYNRPDGTYVRKVSDDCYALCSTVNNDIWIILYQ